VLVLTLDVGMAGTRIRSVGFPLLDRYHSVLLQLVLFSRPRNRLHRVRFSVFSLYPVSPQASTLDG
jgi:hypothetical protein